MRATITVTPISNGKYDFDVTVYNGESVVKSDSFDSINLAVIYAVDSTGHVSVKRNTKAQDFHPLHNTAAVIAQIQSTIDQYKKIRAKLSMKR